MAGVHCSRVYGRRYPSRRRAPVAHRTAGAHAEVPPTTAELVFREADSAPARSIRDARLDEARRMLADLGQGHRSIASVAHSIGIGDPDVLARAFRNRYGTIPSEYRRDRVIGLH